MTTTRRIVLATVFGAVFGLLSAWVARSMLATPLPWQGFLTITAAMTVVGFAIGVNALRLCWWLDGVVFGAIVGAPVALSAVWAGLSWRQGFVLLLVLAVVSGVLVELLTSVILRARKAEARTP